MPPAIKPRRRKLIKPRLQLKLAGLFVGLSALSLLLQFVLFTNRMTHLALELPNDGALLIGSTNRLLSEVLGISFLLFLPLTLGFGILATFRIAGPIYRFETFLASVEAGECPPDFRLRKHDEMHELAAQIVNVTRPLRESSTSDDDEEGDKDENETPIRFAA